VKILTSYVKGAWTAAPTGSDSTVLLVNPANEHVLAQASSAEVDFAGALAFARDCGGPALRALSFAERGAILQRMADLIHQAREELIALAVANGGNTRSDAKFDIDGASATLAAYAELGARLGNRHILTDGDGIQLGRSPRLHGQHVFTPRRGVAVHINAFNFPAWGLAEKAACALLAGMPVVSKPATSTALLAHRLVELVVAAQLVPAGGLSFICGGAGDLLAHLRWGDVVAFTGSGETAAKLRAIPAVVRDGVRLNVEADSLNAAIMGPDVEAGSETEELFVADVVRDMTQKAGQKCTAIRRVFVPAARIDEIGLKLAERLADIRVGDPAHEGVRMGPLVSADQRAAVQAGLVRIASATTEVYTGEAPRDRGYFIAAHLRRADDPAAAVAVHEHEIFGPVATLAPYDGSAAAAAHLVGLGAGGLVAAAYSDDRGFLRQLLFAVASFQGRLFIGSAKLAGHSPGPGTVLPLLTHGGPGRAGGGEELGGERGLALYHQRTALEGDKALIAALLAAPGT
jgi:3,4-dehydroadipyl-CoA semialdehyde dehydrogenase